MFVSFVEILKRTSQAREIKFCMLRMEIVNLKYVCKGLVQGCNQFSFFLGGGYSSLIFKYRSFIFGGIYQIKKLLAVMFLGFCPLVRMHRKDKLDGQLQVVISCDSTSIRFDFSSLHRVLGCEQILTLLSISPY